MAIKEGEREDKVVLWNLPGNKRSQILWYFTAILAGIVVIISLVMLIEWSGFVQSVGVSLKKVPMAPMTAMVFFLLGVVLLLRHRQSISRFLAISTQALLIIVLLISLYLSLQNFISAHIGLSLDIERFLVNAIVSKYGFVVGRMSTLTAITFILASLSILFSSFSHNRRCWQSILANGLACGVIAISAVLLVGYWYEEPLLYGGPTIPVALSTAFCFLLVGAAQLTNGPDNLLNRFLFGNSANAQICRTIIPTSIVIILVGGWLEKVIFGNLVFAARPTTFAVIAMAISITIAVVIPILSRRIQYDINQKEQALQESLQFNSSVLENSPHSILVRNPDASITYVNHALEKLTGFTSGELIGKKDAFPFWTEEQFKKHNGNLEKVISTGIYKQERQFLKKNKEPFWVEVTATPVRSKDQIKYFLSNWTDITERKRAEEALKASEIRYRRLFEAARDGILILNAETGLIIDVNPFLVEMLGFSHKEFLGKKIWELGFLKDIIANKDNFVELQRKGYVRYEGLPLETAAGRRLEVEFVSNVYEVDHQKVIQCNIRDITERKQAEQAQERLSRQLQAKVSELETFSYGIAHDLKSPLVSIESFSRLLREDIQNQKEENVQEDIRLLDTSVRKMQDFLNKTLAYSRAEHLIKRTRNVSFGKIANEVITEFNEQISSIGATVSLAETFPRVYADRMRIAEVLTNLIQNSIKYRDKTVPLKIEIGYRLSEGEVVFFVRDNGVGIDASEAEKVFTLFYRGTADGEGSGIGLAIVKKIIEAHGGRIWVQQGQAGKGTTMCFTLPKQNGTNEGDNNGKD